MIYDSLEHISNYRGMGAVYQALELLCSTDFSVLPLGKHEVDGDELYFSIAEYDTSLGNVAEAHRSYIDVQMLLQGEEYIGVAPLSIEKNQTCACPEKDYWLYECKTQPLYMKKGLFMVLFPNDLHRPGTAIEKPVHCRKVVVKVKVPKEG